jgi:hypothetical protein
LTAERGGGNASNPFAERIFGRGSARAWNVQYQAGFDGLTLVEYGFIELPVDLDTTVF